MTKKWLVVCLLLPLLTIVLFYWAKADSYWFDEMFSCAMANDALTAMWTSWYPYDTHPPLFSHLLWCWVRMFGTGELPGRALPLFFFGLGIGAFFRYTRTWPLGAVVVGCILCFPPITWYYALELRSYSLLHAISILFFFRFRQLKQLDIQGAVLLSLLACTHLYGLVAAGSFLFAHVCLLLRAKDGQQVRRVIWLGCLALLPAALFFGWLAVAGNMLHLTSGQFWIDTSTGEALYFVRWVLAPFWYTGWVPRVVCCLLLLVLLQWRQLLSALVREAFALSLFIAIAALLAINYFSPCIVERYLLVFLPLMALMIAPHITSDFTRQKKGLLIVSLTGFWGVWVYYGWDTLDQKHSNAAAFRQQAAFLAEQQVPVYTVAVPHNLVYFTPYINSRVANFYRKRNYPGLPAYQLIPADSIAQLKPPFALQFVHTEIDWQPGILQALRGYSIQRVEFLGRVGSEAVILVQDQPNTK